MKRIRAAAICSAALSATLLIALPLLTAGCGGGGGVTALPAPTGFVSRATEENISADAKILTARVAEGAFLPLARATEIDRDLASIRAAYPVVGGMRARPQVDLRSLIAIVPKGSLVETKWNAGEVVTGESGLDSALASYSPSEVRTIYRQNGLEQVMFKLSFAQSLNTDAVVAALNAASTGGARFELNPMIGDGDNITLTSAPDGTRTYTFTKAEGDCPAGCTERYFWKFNVSADGVVALAEEGEVRPGTSATE